MQARMTKELLLRIGLPCMERSLPLLLVFKLVKFHGTMMSLSTTPVHLGGDKITFMGPLRFGGSILTSKLIQIHNSSMNPSIEIVHIYLCGIHTELWFDSISEAQCLTLVFEDFGAHTCKICILPPLRQRVHWSNIVYSE